MKKILLLIAANLLLIFGLASLARSQTKVNCFAVSGTNLFAGTDDGVFLSSDSGVNWTSENSGLPPNAWVEAIAVKGTNLFVGTIRSGVFLSGDSGKSWRAINIGLPDSSFVSQLAVCGTNIIAEPYQDGLFRSSNNGESWLPVKTGLGYGETRSRMLMQLLPWGTTILVGTGNDTYLSPDSGYTWTNVTSPFPIFAFTVVGTDVFAATSHGVILSTNGGMDWAFTNTGIPENYSWVVSITHIGAKLFAEGTDGRYRSVFMSTNNGATWSEAGSLPAGVMKLASLGTHLFAGTSQGIYTSTNNGASWSPCKNLWNDRIEARITAEKAEEARKQKTEAAEAKREAAIRKATEKAEKVEAARERKAEAAEAKREAATNKERGVILGPKVAERIASHFMDGKVAMDNCNRMCHVRICLNPLVMNLAALSGHYNDIKNALREELGRWKYTPPLGYFQSGISEEEMLEVLSECTGLSFDELRALKQGK